MLVIPQFPGNSFRHSLFMSGVSNHVTFNNLLHFRTAPSLKIGHLYQILIIMATYKGHSLPIVKAIMSGKAREIYDQVFARVKSLLPETVKPTLVTCDYEPALMGGLSVIFPMAQIVGCWFHFSKVKTALFYFAYICVVKRCILSGCF